MLIIIAIMIGMLFVQPVMGLLSDRFGRRPFVLLGSMFTLAGDEASTRIAGLVLLAVFLPGLWALWRYAWPKR